MSDADDKAAVDRAFADLVAGYHLTADPPQADTDAEAAVPGPAPGSVFELPPPLEPEDEPPPPEEGYHPPPPVPLPRPAWPVLIGWVALGYALLTVIAVAAGAPLPGWAGWAAMIGFVGGFVLLVTRLPRHRPPDAGDGAVL